MISRPVKGKRCFAELKRDIHTGGAAEDTVEPEDTEDTEENTLYQVDTQAVYDQLSTTIKLILKRIQKVNIQDIINKLKIYISDTPDSYIIHIVEINTYDDKKTKNQIRSYTTIKIMKDHIYNIKNSSHKIRTIIFKYKFDDQGRETSHPKIECVVIKNTHPSKKNVKNKGIYDIKRASLAALNLPYQFILKPKYCVYPLYPNLLYQPSTTKVKLPIIDIKYDPSTSETMAHFDKNLRYIGKISDFLSNHLLESRLYKPIMKILFDQGVLLEKLKGPLTSQLPSQKSAIVKKFIENIDLSCGHQTGGYNDLNLQKYYKYKAKKYQEKYRKKYKEVVYNINNINNRNDLDR